MEIKIISVDNANYEFSLAELSKSEWQFFLEGIIIGEAGTKAVHTAMANVSIRDNNAKVKLAFVSDNYHEMCVRLDEYGSTHSRDCDISKSWQLVMSSHFGCNYAKSLSDAISKAECNC